jgi:hypothetical protein
MFVSSSGDVTVIGEDGTDDEDVNTSNDVLDSGTG